ncbi:hypothetical protein GCM10027586_07800 [Kineococcus gypseus]
MGVHHPAGRRRAIVSEAGLTKCSLTGRRTRSLLDKAISEATVCETARLV